MKCLRGVGTERRGSRWNAGGTSETQEQGVYIDKPAICTSRTPSFQVSREIRHILGLKVRYTLCGMF